MAQVDDLTVQIWKLIHGVAQSLQLLGRGGLLGDFLWGDVRHDVAVHWARVQFAPTHFVTQAIDGDAKNP